MSLYTKYQILNTSARRTALLLFVLIFICFGAAVRHVAAASYEYGDLIKGRSNTAVYYVANNGARYVFPNERIYFSWYNNFSGVKTISDNELADIPLGGNIFYRPGTRLLKIESDPRVYAVEPQGQLLWIDSEQTANLLYGINWASRVDDLSAAYFGDYLVVGELDGSGYPIGTLFKYSASGAKYVLDINGGQIVKRMLGSNAFDSLRYKNENVLEISSSFSYPNGSEITAGEDSFLDTAQLAFARPSGVTFTRLDSGNGLLDREAGSNSLMKIRITTEEAVTIKSLTFRVEALTNKDDDYDNGGLVRGNTYENIEPNLSDFIFEVGELAALGPKDIGLSDDEAQFITLSGNYYIAAGKSVEGWIKAHVNSDCPLGEKYKIQLRPYEAVINASDGTRVTEISPGSNINSGELEVREGSVQVNLGSQVASQDIVGGGESVDLVSFDFLTAGDREVKINKISLTAYIDENEGSSDFGKGSDVDNGDATYFSNIVEKIYLYDGTTLVGGPLYTDPNGFFTFSGLNWYISGGEAKTLTVKADIKEDVPYENGFDRIAVDIDRTSSDVTATSGGQTLEVSGNKPNNGANPSVYINVRKSGSLKLQNISGTPEKQIVVAGDSILIAGYKIRGSYEDIRIYDLTFENPSPQADDCFSYVDLTYNNSQGASGSKRGYISGSLVEYEDLNMIVPKNGEVNLSLVLQSRSIEAGCDSGDQASFNLALAKGFYAQGQESGVSYDQDDANNRDYIEDDTTANDSIMFRKTKPTISFNAANPSGDAVRGMSEVLRFDVQADGAGDVKLKKLTFNIYASDAGNFGDDTDLLEYLADVNGDFFDDDEIINLYDLGRPDTYLGEGVGGHIYYSIYDYSGGGKDTSPAGLRTSGKDYGIIEVEFLRGFEPIIRAGETRTYVLELDTVGLDSGEEDVRVDLLTDENLTISNFEWNDGKVDASGYLVEFLPLAGRYLFFH